MAYILSEKRIGIALTGSFCTFTQTFEAMKQLKAQNARLFPIMSANAYTLDTRFYTAEHVRMQTESICDTPIWHTLTEVEPIGPQKLLDLIIVMPCTGNTLSKLAHGIADTSVTMACKSQWRNNRPVLIGVSSNDGLSGSAANIGSLMARKNVFFIPYRQDDVQNKPTSLIYDLDSVVKAACEAMEGRQLQPQLL